MFRHVLRLHRGGMIGYGAASGITMLATGATWARVAGATAASRAAFGRVTAALAPRSAS